MCALTQSTGMDKVLAQNLQSDESPFMMSVNKYSVFNDFLV